MRDARDLAVTLKGKRTATRSRRTLKRAFHFFSPGVVRRSHAAARAAAAAATTLLLPPLLLWLLPMLLYSQFAD